MTKKDERVFLGYERFVLGFSTFKIQNYIQSLDVYFCTYANN